MIRTPWICLICLGVSAAGCKGKSENAPELRSDMAREAVIRTPQGIGAHVKVVRRPNGDLGLLSDIGLDYKPVVQTRYEPMERKY